MQVESSGQTGQIELPENLKIPSGHNEQTMQSAEYIPRNLLIQISAGEHNGKSRENQIGGCTKKNNAKPRKYGQLRILIVHYTWGTNERETPRFWWEHWNRLKVHFILNFHYTDVARKKKLGLIKK